MRALVGDVRQGAHREVVPDRVFHALDLDLLLQVGHSAKYSSNQTCNV